MKLDKPAAYASLVIPVRKSLLSRLEVFVGYRVTESNKHQWRTPGGHRDPGEDSVATAIRELYEETNALVWADDLEFLRQVITEHRQQICQVDSFLLDATEVDLVNKSPKEHSTMLWEDIRVIMKRHRHLLAEGETAGTVPPRLAETFGIMEKLTGTPLNQMANEIRGRYQDLPIERQ